MKQLPAWNEIKFESNWIVKKVQCNKRNETITKPLCSLQSI